jgi:hypothetical protein
MPCDHCSCRSGHTSQCPLREPTPAERWDDELADFLASLASLCDRSEFADGPTRRWLFDALTSVPGHLLAKDFEAGERPAAEPLEV